MASHRIVLLYGSNRRFVCLARALHSAAMRWLGGSASMVLLLWCATALPAHAQALKYSVEIVAPSSLEKLLQANLDIVRWSKRDDVTPGQLAQLYKGAPEQIAELLATEGYFSPHVESACEREKKPEVVRFVVEPGEATRIATIDLRITGPVSKDARASERIAQARKALGINTGDVFRQKQWNAGKYAVVHSLARDIYGAARVSSSKVLVNPQTHSAQLHLEVDSGPPVTFGALVVSGLKRYDRSICFQREPDPAWRSLR